MAALLARLQADLNAARKAQDRARTLVLGTVIAEVKNRQLEITGELTDEHVTDVLRKAIKRRKESVEMYDKGGRPELADKERAEADLLQAYLPAAVSDDEVRAAVRAAIQGGANNLGAIMGKVMAQFKGRAEGSTINGIAREELARQA